MEPPVLYSAPSLSKTRCHSLFWNYCCSDVSLGLKLLVKMDFTRKAQHITSHLQWQNADEKETKNYQIYIEIG